MRLRIDDDTRLLVLTGAGVSAESGVPTFRDANGLWENHPIEQVATPEGFRDDPGLVWRFYSERRRKGKSVHPNPGHLALAEAESTLGERFLLVTQNVDGLHRARGQPAPGRDARPPLRDPLLHAATARRSTMNRSMSPATCHAARPALPSGREGLLRPRSSGSARCSTRASSPRIEASCRPRAREKLVFLAVGTSGLVHPAAGLVMQARGYGAETWLVNAEPPDNLGAFQHFVQGPSGRVLPELFEWSAKAE